jgi:hypothetical protein
MPAGNAELILFTNARCRECGTTRRDWYPSRDRKNDSRKLEVAFSFERVRFVYSDNMSDAPAQASANDPADFKNEENVKRFVRPNRWLALDIAGIPVRFDTRARYMIRPESSAKSLRRSRAVSATVKPSRE